MPSQLAPTLRTQGWRVLSLGDRKAALTHFKHALRDCPDILPLLRDTLHLSARDAAHQRQQALRLMEEMVSVCPGLDYYNGKVSRVGVEHVIVDPSLLDVLQDVLSVVVPASLSGAGTLVLGSPTTYPLTDKLLSLLQLATKHQLASHVYPLDDQFFEQPGLGFFYCMESLESSRRVYKKVAGLNNCMAECFF